MKKSILFLLFTLFLATACKNSGEGQLVGVQERPEVLQIEPYGMVYIPQGHYVMGSGDQEMMYAQSNQSRNVTVSPFFMDQTEIVNNEYRQFVYWVRDSIARVDLENKRLADGENIPAQYRYLTKKADTEDDQNLVTPKVLNWDIPINWEISKYADPSTPDEVDPYFAALYGDDEKGNTIYILTNRDGGSGNSRYYHYSNIELNVKRLVFEYWWTDLRNYKDDFGRIGAAYKQFDTTGVDIENNDEIMSSAGFYSNRPRAYYGGKAPFIRGEKVSIYPDTLCWMHDFTYSYNEPMTRNYFSHPNYDYYPVVGVNWKQARAFCAWRTHYRNSYLAGQGYAFEEEFRLPTEAEWEYAARGSRILTTYPWGTPYTTLKNGCYLSNFKPGRGNYRLDGGVYPVQVGHYVPNDYGLYDMSGNVAEWCDDAFDKSAPTFAHDLNPQYSYYAKKSDHESKKRKVVRGGSWKDVSYYITVFSRTFEYQDTGKAYIGFRCVQSFMGRHIDDNSSTFSDIAD